MTRPLVHALAALFVAFAVLARPTPAVAQDDWEVQRDPFDKKVIGQYKKILERNPGDRDALAKLTRLYRKHRTLALLVTEYEAAIARDATDGAAEVVLGHILLGDGKREDALGHFEKAAARRADDVGLLIALGGLYRQVGKVAEARAVLDRALPLAKARPQKKDLLRALADLAISSGDLPAARKHLDGYLALEPGDVQVRLDVGDALLKGKAFDDAIALFRTAEGKLGADPARRVEVVARIGGALEAAGKDDAAIAEYDRAMGLVQRGYYLRKELTERIIEIHRRRQSLPTLVTRYEKAWSAGSRDHFEWDVLARLYEETGQQDQAIAAFKKAVGKAPWELDTQRHLIALYEASGREPEALAQYEAVIRIAPGEPRFQIELAERWWKRGEEKKALAMLAKLDSRFAGDAGVQSSLADLYTRWGKDDLALAAHQRLVTIEPSEVSHLVNLGEQYFQKNDKPKALEIWKRIAGDKRPESQARLAEVYAEHDMLGESLDLYGKAIKAKPKDPELYKGRASVYERQKSFDQAVTDWEKVLELIPAGKATRAPRREARRQVVNLIKRAPGRKLDARISQWELAFKQRPPELEAGLYLAEAYVRNADPRRARAVLEKLIALDPTDLDSMDQLVKAYETERAYPAAVALLEQMLVKAPGREAELYNRIAEIKTLQHDDEGATRYAQKAVDKRPSDPAAHQELAQRYQEMQKYDLAIGAYEKAISLDPRAFRAYFALARLYRNKHALAEAARLYREVLKRASDDEVLVKAGREAVALEELVGTLPELERELAPLAFTFAHKPVYRRVLVELYERLVPALVAARRRGGADGARADKTLVELGAHGMKPLLEALSDEDDPPQQRIAVAVLGHLRNKAAAAPLIRLATLQTSEPGKRRIGTLVATLDWDVRVEALVAAGRLGDARALPELIALTGHAEVAMREAAVFALGMTAEARATPALILALDDRRDTVQTLACLGLARLSDRQAVAALIRALGDGRRADPTRAACAYALGVLATATALPALTEALAGGNGETQRLAAWALGRLGEERALPALLAAYFAKREGVRDAVAWALPRVVDGTASGPLEAATEFPMRAGKFDQRAAVAALAQPLEPPPLAAALIVGHEDALISGIKTSLERHRDQVLRVLADLDARDAGLALGPLTAALDRAGKAERKQVDAALERIGAALAGALDQLVGHRDPTVRQHALSVLAKIGGEPARAAALRGLGDAELSVRDAATVAAATLAVRHDDDGLRAALVERLAAPGWQDRVAAATAVGRLGARADLAGLARLLGDDKAFVRSAAASALGATGAPAAVAPLIAAATAATEPVVEVRLAAVQALRVIGDGPALGALAAIAKADPEPRVRAAAGRKK